MNSLDYYQAHLMARQVSESFLLAYARAESSGDDTAHFSRATGVEELRRLAAHLGFQLVPSVPIDDAKPEAA